MTLIVLVISFAGENTLNNEYRHSFCHFDHHFAACWQCSRESMAQKEATWSYTSGKYAEFSNQPFASDSMVEAMSVGETGAR